MLVGFLVGMAFGLVPFALCVSAFQRYKIRSLALIDALEVLIREVNIYMDAEAFVNAEAKKTATRSFEIIPGGKK